MKEYFNKLIVESPRDNHADSFREQRHRVYTNLDEFGGKMGRKRLGAEKTKSFGETLSPLYRYLEKQVNRPWDKVYSEICRQFDTRKIINSHILAHIYDVVAKREDVVILDGRVYIRNYSHEPTALKDSFRRMYVDPRDGILKRNREYRSPGQHNKELARDRQAIVDANKVIVSEKEEFFRVKGIWFKATIDVLPLKPSVRLYRPVGLFGGDRHDVYLSREERLKRGWKEEIEWGVKFCKIPWSDIGPLPPAPTKYGWRLDFKTPGVFSGYPFSTPQPGQRYYSSFKTASHKDLKRAKIVK